MSAVYCALVHYPVRDRQGHTVTSAITNVDVHDLARSARTYGLAGYFIVTPIEAQRRLVSRILEHWRTGAGRRRVPERTEALSLCESVPSVEAAVEAISAREGRAPRVVVTSARPPDGATTTAYAEEAARLAADGPPTLILFGTGHGLARELVDGADVILAPIAGPTDYNHLSVRAAAAITFDRLFARPR